MKVAVNLPLLYRELASWWPVLSAPADYAEEATFYRQTILAHLPGKPQAMLELGCGGGNNATHLKEHFQLTLVDLSPQMLEVSRALNPECEHQQGDMRTIRLGREFDVVFIHDAIGYMTTLDQLGQAIQTAFVHCRPGGAALLAPDCTRETFKPKTDHGGHDLGGRSLRYLEWTWDPDPHDSTYVCDMVYVLREKTDKVRIVYDRHLLGLFSQGVWLHTLTQAGFEAQALPFIHSQVEPGSCDVFLGLKPVE